MSEEVQVKELAETVDKYHIGCNLAIECNTECNLCAAKAIYELGYRKLLRDKPPLIKNFVEIMKQARVDTSISLFEIYKKERRLIAQAQREADIKHYEES